jgi:ribulose bisphosphate carboxylase small subunit
MGLFSQMLGYRELNLASNSVGSGRALSTGLAPKESDRIKGELLEEDYRYDTVTFNIINKQLEMIMQAGFEIKTKRAMNQKFYDDFFESIGDIGEEITKDELVEYILQDMLMYGNSYVELIFEYGDITKRIVDLKMIPSKRMDYIKKSDGSVATDIYGKPIGYLMKFSNMYNVDNLGDKVPKQYEGIAIKNANEIFFLRERIAHFKLHTYGDRNYGIGLIEPAHTSTYRKLLIEEARTNEIYTRGANTIVASVGDIDHEPTPENLNDVLANISNWKHDRYFSFPYWVKLENQAIEQNDAVDKTLEYLRINQAASAGMPMAFATGAGEATNRATLNNQQDILELSLEHVVNKFCSAFNKYILRRIAETNKIKDIAEIKFGEIITEEKNNKSKRLVEAIQNKIIAPEEAREYFIKAEDLIKNDSAYKKFLEESKKANEPQQPVSWKAKTPKETPKDSNSD